MAGERQAESGGPAQGKSLGENSFHEFGSDSLSLVTNIDNDAPAGWARGNRRRPCPVFQRVFHARGNDLGERPGIREHRAVLAHREDHFPACRRESPLPLHTLLGKNGLQRHRLRGTFLSTRGVKQIGHHSGQAFHLFQATRSFFFNVRILAEVLDFLQTHG